jgi:hypothetical protein
MSCERDFLPLRVNSLPLATIYEVKTPLRKWKISLLQRNPAHMISILHTCDLGGIDCLSRWIFQSSKTKLAGLPQYNNFALYNLVGLYII